MITEIADIKIRPEQRTEFLSAIHRAAQTVLCKANGYVSHQILPCVESPGRVVLIVNWQTLEDHTVGFRESAAFADWRAIIGPYFAQPPHVEHFQTSLPKG